MPEGDHVVSAKINPFNAPGFEQESTENDLASGVLTIFPIPDVYVDANALPTVPSVQSGEDVEWRVTMENTGDIGVSGNIQYTFDGLTGQSPPILLDAGQAFTWTVTLPTALGAHTAEFEGPMGRCPRQLGRQQAEFLRHRVGFGGIQAEARLGVCFVGVARC